MERLQITPQAAPRPVRREGRHPLRKPPQTPLQVRLPREEVRKIKIAAAEREQAAKHA
jgi:hypothetical protein